MNPLRDVRVVDLTHAVSGPFCTNQLRLLGAEVIKVERPDGGDDFRSRREPSGRTSTFDALNAGKRSVALDLKREEGLAQLLALVAGADILVENFRPGVMDELGLSWDRLRSANPRLVYCSITGFGQSGDLRDVPAIEWSVQAASGMTAAYVDRDADPLRLGLSVLDPFTGYLAFARILAALRERDLTGQGVRLDIAMLDAAFTLMWPQVVETAVSEPGRARPRLGRRGTMARFPTSDGMIFIAALHQRWFEGLCEELGVPELAADERFADPAARSAHPDDVYQALAARTAAFAGPELETRLTRRGIPAAVVRSLEAAMALSQVVQRRLLEGAEAVGPELGADTESVLARLKVTEA